MALYREDYDGNNSGTTLAQCGLPSGLWVLRPYLGGSADVLHCPDAPAERIAWLKKASHGQGWTDYRYNICPEAPPCIPGMLGTSVQRLGDSFPLVFCYDHDFPPPNLPVRSHFILAMHLDGSVKAGPDIEMVNPRR